MIKSQEEKFLIEVLASFLEFWRLNFKQGFLHSLLSLFFFSVLLLWHHLLQSSLSLSLSKTIPFTFLLFVSQIMSVTVPGQVGGLTALNTLHNIFVFSKALMQALTWLLLQWVFHTVCQWVLWIFDLGFHPLFIILRACRSHGSRNYSWLVFFI